MFALLSAWNKFKANFFYLLGQLAYGVGLLIGGTLRIPYALKVIMLKLITFLQLPLIKLTNSIKNLTHRIKYKKESKRFARAVGLSISNFAKEDSFSGNAISAEKLVGIVSWVKETCKFYPEYNKKVVNVNLGSLKPPSGHLFDTTPPLLYQKSGNGIFRTLLSKDILHVFKDHDIWSTAGNYNLQWYDAIVKMTGPFLSYYDDIINVNKIEETEYIFILGEINSDENLYYSLIPPSKDEFVLKENGSDITSMADEVFYKDIKLNILDVKEKK